MDWIGFGFCVLVSFLLVNSVGLGGFFSSFDCFSKEKKKRRSICLGFYSFGFPSIPTITGLPNPIDYFFFNCSWFPFPFYYVLNSCPSSRTLSLARFYSLHDWCDWNLALFGVMLQNPIRLSCDSFACHFFLIKLLLRCLRRIGLGQ